MVKKKQTPDIVELWVAADMIKTQKAFREAINTALPDAGRWVYRDMRKKTSMFKVCFHPEIVRTWENKRVNQAKEWLADIQPKLEDHGIRVLSAAVNICSTDTKTPQEGYFDNILLTKEFWDRWNAKKGAA